MITFQNVHKSFGDKHILTGFDLHVERGESMVIIGGSGTGKSVSLKCVLGLLTPEQGEIYVDGKPVVGLTGTARDEVNARIGMLFQNAALFDSLSVWENVAFRLIEGMGKSRSESRHIALEKLAQVGLAEHVADMSPADLSGGMRKRVGLARAIATNPEIIFFDEPTTGLDPIMGHVIDDLIVKCVKEIGATGLTITHDMASAKRIADKFCMLYQGKNIWTGNQQGLDDGEDARVYQFINGIIDGPIPVDAKR